MYRVSLVEDVTNVMSVTNVMNVTSVTNVMNVTPLSREFPESGRGSWADSFFRGSSNLIQFGYEPSE